MDISVLDDRSRQVYEFMLRYQHEHKDEPVPPTLGEIQEELGIPGRNGVLLSLRRLVEAGLVRESDRGWRRYSAVEPTSPNG